MLFKVRRTKIDRGGIALTNVMKNAALRASHLKSAAPAERYKHHRILQAFTAVHSDNLDSVLVTLKSEQRWIISDRRSCHCF